jgi:UDP-2-acetamido-2-deoxy-ribo-hexuluronate aminotransferase
MEFIDLKSQYQNLKTEIDTRVHRVLDHGQYIMGPEVTEMESKLAEFTGVKHCISCASGTEALLMGLMALGIGPGDEVITTPFTFAATAEVIALVGAKPVFVDIEADTCLIDARLIEAKINPNTKAIMPVSLYGQVCDMDEINAIAARHGNIPVIEDAAQSFGATYKSKKSCNLSTIGCTSFFPSKPLGCYGDGGAIFTNDDVLATAMREIRVHGQERRYYHTRIGLGGRMDTIQCAVILGKLTRFNWEIARRQALAEEYRACISSSETAVAPLFIKPDRSCVWAQYTIFTENRESLQFQLKERGIPTAVHYPIPLNHQPAYAHYCCIECTPISNEMSKKVMSLPMSPDLTVAEVQQVIRQVVASVLI